MSKNIPQNQLPQSAPLIYAEAFAYWQCGRTIQSSNKLNAIAIFRWGIERLGNFYQNQNTIDDTGMKLVFAQAKESGGDLNVAAALFEKVLHSRLSIYAHKFGLKSPVQHVLEDTKECC
ncbi:hypothetical protein [Candidatus Parabeggiatoa sp. HSG14]|uniref:hypothetical protein n=1 Tax=Candidatus Parabeggiatoa sp. HSG14 TaxID=3055593 RepID=UPI0025A76649|nr:hypothetical protein [Thiotrichales bacterium HSG14]